MLVNIVEVGVDKSHIENSIVNCAILHSSIADKWVALETGGVGQQWKNAYFLGAEGSWSDGAQVWFTRYALFSE